MAKSKSSKKGSKKAAPKTKSQASKVAPKKVISVNKIGIVPLGDRVLVKPLSAEESATATSFGILIPDTAKEKPEQGIVVAVGPGKVGDDNEYIAMQVKVGDRVMFSKYGYDEMKVGGVEYFMVREESILAILA